MGGFSGGPQPKALLKAQLTPQSHQDAQGCVLLTVEHLQGC